MKKIFRFFLVYYIKIFCFFFGNFQDGKEEEVILDFNVLIDNSTLKKSKLKYLLGERKDTGEYIVVVVNKYGFDDVNIEVVVLGKFCIIVFIQLDYV